jgi:DNA-directed RNA polymerase specialized sigma subunit
MSQASYPDPQPLEDLFRDLVPVAVAALNEQFGSRCQVEEASLWSAYPSFVRSFSREEDEYRNATTREAIAAALIRFTLQRKWRREHEGRRWEALTRRPLGADGQPLAFDPPDPKPDPATAAEKAELAECLREGVCRVLAELGGTCREVARLYWEKAETGDKPLQKAIAEELGISETKVSLCMSQLWDGLAEEFRQPPERG